MHSSLCIELLPPDTNLVFGYYIPATIQCSWKIFEFIFGGFCIEKSTRWGGGRLLNVIFFLGGGRVCLQDITMIYRAK